MGSIIDSLNGETFVSWTWSGNRLSLSLMIKLRGRRLKSVIRHLQADVQRGIIEIGFELLAAKSQVRHGGWADWLQKEFE